MSIQQQPGLSVPHPEIRAEDRAERRGYLAHGALAGVAAAIVVAALAAGAERAGVGFEIPQEEQRIPWAAFPQSVLLATAAGLVLAAGVRRWSHQPTRRFVQATVTLVGASLVPPFALGADGPTTATLVTLHLVAAAIVIPAVTRSLDRGARCA